MGTSHHRVALTSASLPSPHVPPPTPHTHTLPRAWPSLPSLAQPRLSLTLRSPTPAAGMNSVAPGTAVQPQESVGAGAGAGAETALQLPALLLGAPALLGLALALVLVALVSWRRRQRRLSSPGLPEARDIEQDGKLRVSGTQEALPSGRGSGRLGWGEG